MFTYKNIKELENIINYLNTTDEPRIDEMSNMTENIQSFLNIIASIKPNKAKNAAGLYILLHFNSSTLSTFIFFILRFFLKIRTYYIPSIILIICLGLSII